MMLFTKEQERRLIMQGLNPGPHNKPVVKWFGGAACTWLVSEIDPQNNDRVWALCDIGQGFVEYGWLSIEEMKSLKFPPFGTRLERDYYFKADRTMDEYLAKAKQDGNRIYA